MQTLILLFLVFFGTLAALLGIFLFVKSGRERQLTGVSKTEIKKITGEVESPHPFLEEVKSSLMNVARKLGGMSAPRGEEDLSHIQKELLKLGYRSRSAVHIFFGFKVLCAILLPILFFLLKVLILKPIAPMMIMVASVILAIIGFYAPFLWLRIQISARKEKILNAFPDALDLLVVCVESGMGLDSAIRRVGDEMKMSNREISDEFRLLNLELSAGKSRRDALRNFALRIDLEDVTSLVNILIQTDRFGTSVAQALRIHSDSMRTKRYQKAEELAVKLPVKLVFPLITCIFPSLFVIILGPPLIQAFRVWSSGQ